MMRKPFKKCALVGCLCALAMCLTAGVGSLKTVSADAVTPDLQIHGASVRKADDSGLRFTFSVDKAFKDAGYTFGTLIIPAHVLGNDTLNHNDDGADDVDVEYVHIAQEKWATSVYREIKAEKEDHFYEEGREYFNAVLLDIPNTDYGTTIVACGYAVKDGVYYYSKPVERSIAQVAAAALQDGETGTLLENYVDTALGSNSLAMNVSQGYLSVGATQTLDVLNDNDYAATWKSSKESVATVDNTGKVTAKAAGKATISATIGSKTVEAVVQVGAAIEGDKVVDFTAENYTSKVTPGNAKAAYSNTHSYNGEGMIELTGTMNWQLNMLVKSVDISQCTQLKVMVYQETGFGRIFRAYINGAYTSVLTIQSGSWAEYIIDVSEITAPTLDVKFYFGKNTSGDGQINEKVYISDVYAAGERRPADIPVGAELILSMSEAVANKTFVNDGVNASVSFTSDYIAYGSGMAKITATNNWQSAGYYNKNMDVSAYSKIVFKVFRPAGEGGYFLRVKSKNGSSYPQIYTEASKAKNAGEWVEVTINVSQLTNSNLVNLIVQFGTTDSTTGAQAQGTAGKYILVSDIYGIK